MKSPRNIRAFRRSLLRWFRRHSRDLPWRKTRDPYAILVSEFMLQQTQVASVIPYYNKWLRRFPDFASVARASQNDVLHAWQGLGYYNRVRNLHATAKIVQNRYRGVFPCDVTTIRKLPGVGRYTANAVATFAF
ncbi:MAG TPA: A/G-specific adenine glycosylase, partial [Candidatus Udaeobacter sp.]|nr:A/G-specific adenine glycosylase [Candidatus Udaeobacter sp.]